MQKKKTERTNEPLSYIKTRGLVNPARGFVVLKGYLQENCRITADLNP